MDSTLAIILKAQDQMSGAVNTATAAAVGLDAATTQAGESMETAGKQAEKAAGQTDEAAAASRVLMAALWKQEEATQESATRLKRLEEALADTEKKQASASKSSEGFATKLDHLMGIAEKAGRFISGAFRMAAESMARAAEQGDEASKSVLGQFAQMQRAGDSIGATFAQTLAPALHPVTKGIEDMSRSMADWIKTNQIGKTIIVAAIQELLDLATAAQIVRDEYEKWKESIKSVGQEIIDKQNGAAKGAISWLSGATERGEKHQKNLERIKERYAELQAQVDKGIALKGEDLLTYQQFGEVVGQLAQNDFGKKIADQNKPHIKETASALDDLRARLLTMLADAKNAKDTDFSFIGDPKAAREARDKMNEEVSASLGDLSSEIAGIVDGMIAKDQEYLDAADEAAIRAEELSQQRAADIMALAELKAKETDEAIANIELEGLTEEQATLKKIDLYQKLADASVNNAEIRKNAERSATLEINKLGDQLAEKWKTNVHKVQSVFTSMASVLLDSSKSTSEKLKTIFTQITDMVTANMQKQLEVAIDTSAKSAAASAAGAAKEAGAASAGIVPKILSKAAELPFPANTIVAGLAIAAFNVLAKKIVSFFEDGGVVGGGGIVGGFGRRDSVINAVMPGEGVINRPATDAIGKSTVDYINQNKALPPGSGGGPTVVNLNMRLTADRGVILMPQQVALETAPFIIDLINTAVKDHGYHLYASDLLVSLPQPAGA